MVRLCYIVLEAQFECLSLALGGGHTHFEHQGIVVVSGSSANFDDPEGWKKNKKQEQSLALGACAQIQGPNMHPRLQIRHQRGGEGTGKQCQVMKQALL